MKILMLTDSDGNPFEVKPDNVQSVNSLGNGCIQVSYFEGEARIYKFDADTLIKLIFKTNPNLQEIQQ